MCSNLYNRQTISNSKHPHVWQGGGYFSLGFRSIVLSLSVPVHLIACWQQCPTTHIVRCYTGPCDNWCWWWGRSYATSDHVCLLWWSVLSVLLWTYEAKGCRFNCCGITKVGISEDFWNWFARGSTASHTTEAYWKCQMDWLVRWVSNALPGKVLRAHLACEPLT